MVSRCRASSLAVWPGTILFFVRCVPPLVGATLAVARLGLHRPLANNKVTGVAIRNPHAMYPLFYPRHGAFCQQRQKVLKERRQNQGFGILPRLECVPCGKAFATRTERAGLPPCFRIAPAPPSAGRSRGPALAWRGRGGFCVYRGAYKSLPRTRRGRCLHRPAHRTSCNPSVGRGALTPPPVNHRISRQGTRALPYKVLRYRDWADRVVRPYNPFVGADAHIVPPPPHRL